VEEGGAVLQKGPFGSLPLRRTRLLWCWCPLRSQFTPIVWRPLRGKTHDHVTRTRQPSEGEVSYGPPWAHYLGGYQERLLGGPLGLPDLRCTTPDGVKHKDYRGEVLG
jgi:hypothetical protein